jgi:hypothetical protein
LHQREFRRLEYFMCLPTSGTGVSAGRGTVQGFEGIVSKRRVGLYLPGPASGWIKVKTREWREANRERYKLFEKT